MIVKLYQSNDNAYIKPESVDAIIPVKDEKGNFMYTSIFVNGQEIKADCGTDLLIHSKMKQDW